MGIPDHEKKELEALIARFKVKLGETVVQEIEREVYDDAQRHYNILGRLYFMDFTTGSKSLSAGQKAVRYLKKAAESQQFEDESEPTYYILATVFLIQTGDDNSLYNYDEALVYYEKAGIRSSHKYEDIGLGFYSGEIYTYLFNNNRKFKHTTKIKRDFKKAVEWLDKYLESTFVSEESETLLTITYMYYNGGFGLEKNYSKALEYLAQLPDKECLALQKDSYLARIYAEGGYGVEKNMEKAMFYCGKHQDDLYVILGEIYQFHKDPPEYNNALEWYNEAIKSNKKKVRDNGYKRLAWMHLKGLGVSRNSVEAYNLVQQISVESDDRNFYELYFYQHNLRKNDPVLTFHNDLLLDKIYDYRAILLNIFGINSQYHSNFEQAKSHFESAIDYGCIDSNNGLGDIYRLGQGVEVDEEQAFEYYKKAAEAKNDNNGHYNLGLMYLEGKGTEVDYKQALFWLKKAQSLGNEQVQQPFLNLIEKMIALTDDD